LLPASPKELRVKSTGLLDLTQFDSPTKVLKFAGKVKLIFEPGSKLVLGGGVLEFTDETQFAFERVLDEDLLLGSEREPRDLDNIRVKIIGRGNILMEENSVCQILENQFVGIETDLECDNITSITWRLFEQAKVQIGTSSRPGGSFQVGNTACQNGSSIDLTIILNGVGTAWEINRQGFMGLGVGMANKVSQFPNQWLVNCLENVFGVFINIPEGTFKHNQIRSGDEITASLLAIGPADQYSWTFDAIQAIILGGGNLVQITNCTDNQCNERMMQMDKNKMKPEMRDMLQEATDIMQRAEMMMEEAKEMMKHASVTRGPSKMNKLKDARDMMVRCRSMKDQAYRIMRNVTIPSINPVVQDTAGVIDNNLQVSIMSGKLLLIDTAKGAQPVSVSPQAFFNYLATLPHDSQNSPRSNIFRDQVAISTLGFIDDIGGTLVNPNIRRDLIQAILGVGGFNFAEHDHSLRIGATSLNLDNVSRAAVSVNELRGTQGL